MAVIGGDEAARSLVSGIFAATGQSASAVFNGIFNFNLWGTFVGTVLLERSFDGGTTWLPLTALGTAIIFTGPCSEVFEEHEAGVKYRARCSPFTSGSINYRISQ